MNVGFFVFKKVFDYFVLFCLVIVFIIVLIVLVLLRYFLEIGLRFLFSLYISGIFVGMFRFNIFLFDILLRYLIRV